MSDLRDIAVKYAHLLSASDYSKLLNLADEIERLEADAENLRNTITSTHLSLKGRDAEIERLKVVADAARDFINNHMDHDDAMRIFDALAALEDDDE